MKQNVEQVASVQQEKTNDKKGRIMGRFEEIAYELAKVWNSLTREEIRDWFDISDRSLYRYQNMLQLRKETQKPITKSNSVVPMYINTPDNKVQKKQFKSWEHFVLWTKSQEHPYTITDSNIINMDDSKLTEDARKFRQRLKV